MKPVINSYVCVCGLHQRKQTLVKRQARGLVADICFSQNLCCNDTPCVPFPHLSFFSLTDSSSDGSQVQNWISIPQIAQLDKLDFFELLQSLAMYSKLCIKCVALWINYVCRQPRDTPPPTHTHNLIHLHVHTNKSIKGPQTLVLLPILFSFSCFSNAAFLFPLFFSLVNNHLSAGSDPTPHPHPLQLGYKGQFSSGGNNFAMFRKYFVLSGRCLLWICQLTKVSTQQGVSVTSARVWWRDIHTNNYRLINQFPF